MINVHALSPPVLVNNALLHAQIWFIMSKICLVFIVNEKFDIFMDTQLDKWYWQLVAKLPNSYCSHIWRYDKQSKSMPYVIVLLFFENFEGHILFIGVLRPLFLTWMNFDANMDN